MLRTGWTFSPNQAHLTRSLQCPLFNSSCLGVLEHFFYDRMPNLTPTLLFSRAWDRLSGVLDCPPLRQIWNTTMNHVENHYFQVLSYGIWIRILLSQLLFGIDTTTADRPKRHPREWVMYVKGWNYKFFFPLQTQRSRGIWVRRAGGNAFGVR